MCLLGLRNRASLNFLLLISIVYVHRTSLLILSKPVKSLCVANGLDVLREMRDIKRLRATFDLDSVSIYLCIRDAFSHCKFQWPQSRGQLN